MKKIISIFIIAIVLGISSIAMAEKPSVTVGLKTWVASWETVSFFTDDAIETDYGLMYGPAVNLRYQNFFGGLSYMLGTFSFPTETAYSSLSGFYDVQTDADRTDLDIWAGYFFHRNIAVFLGYKSFNFDFTDNFDDGSSDETNLKFNGPVLGVMGYYQLGDSRWALFGNLGYVMLDGEVEGEPVEDVKPGTALEFGGAYSAETLPLSVTIGLKYQNYEYRYFSKDVEDIFSGLTLGANYTF